MMSFWIKIRVHGGIRHLENTGVLKIHAGPVHGGIRHLEN